MIISDVLSKSAERAERELDRMSARLPQTKPPTLPFEEYLPRAIAYARGNEQFARELARALHQAQKQGR